VDCGGIERCTDEGAQTFYDMMTHTERRKARIIVVNLSSAVREALRHTPEVRSRMAVAGTVDEARRSLDLMDTIASKKDARGHSTGLLILALSGGAADPFAIAVAGALAELRQLRVVAMYPIVVPQSLPTNTPLPEKETAAEGALNRAKEMLKARNIPVEPTIERTRSLAAAVEKAAAEMDERLAIVSLPDLDHQTREPSRTAEELLAKLSTEVILVRQPM
jgi:hypothetical protein